MGANLILTPGLLIVILILIFLFNLKQTPFELIWFYAIVTVHALPTPLVAVKLCG